MRLTQQTKEQIKQDILSVLSDKSHTTQQVSKSIGRSWRLTKRTLEQLQEEKKISAVQIIRNEWKIKALCKKSVF